MTNFFRIHPQDLAIDFLEFVGRTKGAEHLKVQSGHLNLLQYYNVDVLVFLATAITLLVYTLIRILQTCLSNTRAKTKTE